MEATKRAAAPVAPEVAALKVGDTVVVAGGYGSRGDWQAKIIKVARVWITVEGRNGYHEFRFRRDNQGDSSDYSPLYRFWTLEQWEAKRIRDEASTYLRDQGIDLRGYSPWYDRKVELANILKAAEAAASAK